MPCAISLCEPKHIKKIFHGNQSKNQLFLTFINGVYYLFHDIDIVNSETKYRKKDS